MIETSMLKSSKKNELFMQFSVFSELSDTTNNLFDYPYIIYQITPPSNLNLNKL